MTKPKHNEVADMGNSKPSSLQEHAEYCIQQAMRHDRERMLCAMLAPVEARTALTALLAWNIEIARIGEIASEEMIGLIRYQWWRDALDEFYEGKPPRQHAVVLALAGAIEQFSLPRQRFMDILDAREADLERSPFATDAELASYARTTGGELLLLWLDVLGVDDPVAHQAVADVGEAWARIGVVRASHHLAHQGKLRLPLGGEAPLDADTLLQQGFDNHARTAIAAVATQAHSLLQQARAAQKNIPPQALPPLYLAIQAEDFLQRLQKSAYDPASPRITHGRAIRALKLWWASIRQRY